jgi:hypothetical protein
MARTKGQGNYKVAALFVMGLAMAAAAALLGLAVAEMIEREVCTNGAVVPPV